MSTEILKIFRYGIAAAALASFPVACDSPSEDATEEMGEDIEDVADDAGDEVEDTTEY